MTKPITLALTLRTHLINDQPAFNRCYFLAELDNALEAIGRQRDSQFIAAKTRKGKYIERSRAERAVSHVLGLPVEFNIIEPVTAPVQVVTITAPIEDDFFLIAPRAKAAA